MNGMTFVIGIVIGLAYAYTGMLIIILADRKIGRTIEHFVDESVCLTGAVITTWPLAIPIAWIVHLVRRRRAKTTYPDFGV